MLHAVIPAGGSGTRLWPLSRADHPKFLLPLPLGIPAPGRSDPAGSTASLLQSTMRRLGQLVPPERTLVVCGRPHAAAIADQLPELPAENLLVEPSPRDSCPAIGLAAAVVARRDPTAVMGSFAADHQVRDTDRFTATIEAAVRGAEQGWLMTVGMTPTSPETGFGYLQYGEQVGDGPIHRVRRFKEKPTYEVAVELVSTGEYLWNASMFLWRVDTFLAELARQQPEMHAGLVRIASVWDTPDRAAVLAEVWPELPKIAVDYAVMEGAAAQDRVATVPGDFGWSDVGDFGNLADLLPADPEHGNVAEGEVLVRDSAGTVVIARGGRLVATLGLKDVIVVDTPDALLVCARDRAQDVKQIADAVRREGGPS